MLRIFGEEVAGLAGVEVLIFETDQCVIGVEIGLQLLAELGYQRSGQEEYILVQFLFYEKYRFKEVREELDGRQGVVERLGLIISEQQNHHLSRTVHAELDVLQNGVDVGLI